MTWKRIEKKISCKDISSNRPVTPLTRKLGHADERETFRKTESLQIAAQDNAIRTNYVKAKIDKTQQNSKCRLYGDRDEMNNHMISEWSKLTQKEYKTRHSWLGKVIHWELCHHHHHDVVPLAWISLILSRHFSLSFIASGRSSGLHPVPSHSCWMYVRAGRPAFARPYVGVHRSTSLMSSSLLLQRCPACLVRLAWIVFVMGGRWPYNWCLVGCCHQDLFNIARSILV